MAQGKAPPPVTEECSWCSEPVRVASATVLYQHAGCARTVEEYEAEIAGLLDRVAVLISERDA